MFASSNLHHHLWEEEYGDNNRIITEERWTAVLLVRGQLTAPERKGRLR